MRGLLHKVHRWVGFGLCVPLVTLGLTGSILVFQHELGDTHYTMQSGTPHSAGEILEAARVAAPEGFSPLLLRVAKTGEPASVSLTQEGRKSSGGRRVQLLIDPVSLAVLNKDDSNSLMRQIFQFHSSLLLRDYGGRSIVGWFGVAMLMLGITGLVLWWPRNRAWRQAFTIKRGAKGFRLHRDIHGAVGIWGFLVFITVSFTGVYLAFPQTMEAGIGSIFAARDLRAPPKIKTERAGDAVPMSVDDAVALAQQKVEGSMLAAFMLGKPGQPYRIALVMPGYGEGAPMISVFVDPWARAVIEVRDPKDYSIGETIISWQHTLHAGQGLGWVWQILVFITGLMPLLFFYTGISMLLAKRRAR
jgi:uncharacterized iron-regulated membrane protein